MNKYKAKSFLTYIFAIIFIFFVTLLLAGLLLDFLIFIGVLSKDSVDNPIIIIISLLISSTIFGIFITITVNRNALRDVSQFVEGINGLAKGDFSIRLNIKSTPEFIILSKNFNIMAEELASIQILRRDFINNFSHEFKTPIISIKGFAEILKDDNLTKEERDEYLDIVINESDRLSRLSSSILDLSKLETQCILSEKDSFNIGDQIRQCILILDSNLDAKSIDLDADIIDVNYIGNKEMLNQVWINLIENAIKFTPTNGIISVCLKHLDNNIEITIRDSGRGISKEDLAKIFDKFYQVDTSHSESGNGLGLTLVKKIMDLHNGTIECRSELGIGTEFKITLPL